VILEITIKAFKGFAADCLITTNIPLQGSSGFALENLYVAVFNNPPD
jgi:hypothetical protein